MRDADSRIIESVEDLIEANRAARQVMRAGEEILRQGIERLRAGQKISETLADVSAGSQRQATQEANERIADARHTLRVVLIGRCLDEGMRPWEIADAWGMSRQRVDRYIQEIKRGSEDVDVTH